MKHVVITGANRGIGLALAEQYHQQGFRVTAICRSSTPGIERVAAKVISGVDVTKETGLNAMVDGLKDETIDLLINNAGLLQDEVLGSIDFDSIRQADGNQRLCPVTGYRSALAKPHKREQDCLDYQSHGLNC